MSTPFRHAMLLLCIASASSASPLHACTASDEVLLLYGRFGLPNTVESMPAANVKHTEVHYTSGTATAAAPPSAEPPSAEPPRTLLLPARAVPANDQQRLFLAVSDGDLHRVQALLSSPDVDVNAAYNAQAKTSLLDVAARNCLPEITEALIRKGARVRANSALSEGIEVRPVGSLMLSLSVAILMRDHPVTIAGAPAHTLEHYGATLRILLDAGADASELADSTEHLSALGELADIAPFNGDARIAQLLLDHGAALDDSPSATSPLLVAVGRGRADLASAMLATGRLAEPTLDAALLQSAQIGQYAMASEILSAGANPNASDRSRHSLLCDSLLRLPRSRSFALDLVAHHADVNAVCPGANPLVLALKDREIAGVLLDRGADPNRPDEMGATPLALAGTDDHELVDHLLASGGNVGVPIADAAAYRQRGATIGAVAWSILHHRDYLAAQLIERNKLDAARYCGAVLYAASEGSTLALSELLEHGEDPNATSEHGMSALMIAALHGQASSLQILLAQPRIQVNQTTPIEFHPPHFELYSEKSPLPWFTGHQSALMFAVAGRQPEAARILLAHGADADQKDIEGHTAREYPESQIVRQLSLEPAR